MKTSILASTNASSLKKTKSAASRESKRKSDEADDYIEFVGTLNEDGRPNTRYRRQILVQKEKQKKPVKQEFPSLLEGIVFCPEPECRQKVFASGGCNLITCINKLSHPEGGFVHFCGYCLIRSENGESLKCQCNRSFKPEARAEELAKPIELLEEEVEEEEEEEANTNTSRASAHNPFASEMMGDSRDSGTTNSGSDDGTKTASDNAMNEDEDVENEDPTAVVADRAIKQEPDTAVSTAFDDDTVRDDFRPEDVKSTAIPIVIKTEVDEETDVEDSTTSKEEGGEEEDDICALLYQESQRRKKDAEAAKQKGRRTIASKKRNKASSTQEDSAATAQQEENEPKKKKARSGMASKSKKTSLEDENEKEQTKRDARKKYRYECSADGCTNTTARAESSPTTSISSGVAAEVVTPMDTPNAFAKDAHRSNSRSSTATTSNSRSGPAFNTRASNSKKEGGKGGTDFNNPAIDPLSDTIEGFDKGSSNVIAYAVNKMTLKTEELICGSCKDLLDQPMRVSCCKGVYCFDCLPYSGSCCPGCREDYGKVSYCREIGDEIEHMNIHCPGNCGWFGPMKDHKLHWSLHCYQADVKRIAANKVRRFIRADVDRQIQQITEQGAMLRLNEPLDIKRTVATNVFRRQCKEIEHKIALEMDEIATTAEQIDEQIRKEKEEKEQARLQQSNAANKAIQRVAKNLEELSNSISTKTFGGGVHQTFNYGDWESIHRWITLYATKLFGDQTKLYCVDLGAGILVACISGSATNENTRWIGCEIDPNRLFLGGEIYKMFLEKWSSLSGAHQLHVGFLQADCTSPMNLRGCHCVIFWDRAFTEALVDKGLSSLARSYTHPFLLVMSNHYWKDRTIPLITKKFQHVQVVGCSPHYSFRGGKGAGDTLIMAIVGTPTIEELEQSPALDKNSVSVIDVLSNRFETTQKQLAELERLSERCTAPTQRMRVKTKFYGREYK